MATQPRIRFVTTSDGVRIAYCSHGSGPPLLFVRGWISHLEGMWEIPEFQAYISALAEHFTVVRYDTRGQGTSDQDVEDVDLDGLVRDIEAITGHLQLEDVILYGQTFGGPIAIAYAARHPYRVSKLILDGTYARSDVPPEEQEALVQTLERLWPHSLGLIAQLTSPGESPRPLDEAAIDWHRRALTARMVGHLYRLAGRLDVTELLPSAAMPALVVHRRRSTSIPLRSGADLAARLPNADFVTLEGTAHNPWDGDAQAMLDAIGDFLEVRLTLPQADAAPTTPMAILFTDMEASTAMTSTLGDARAQELVRTHDAVVREAVGRFGGNEVKHTGDGVMASFPSISSAIECAVEVQRGLRRVEAPFRVKIGIDAGEPLLDVSVITGTVVQSARRIVDRAEPGQILVSDVVRRLVAGRRFDFVDTGRATLKGLPERVRLFEVGWELTPGSD